MIPAELHFLRPQWLLALLPIAIAALAWWLQRRRDNPWRTLVDAHLLPYVMEAGGERASRLPLLLLSLGGICATLALAGPAWERLPQPVRQAVQYRVVLLDLSPTMNAPDVAPTRLARARFELLDLLRRAREGQTALIAFGAEPYIVSPLSADAATIAAQVPLLESGLLPVQGARRTDLALREALALLRQAGAGSGDVILISDGIEAPASALAAAGELRSAGFRVSAMGVGTAEGAPVARPGGAGNVRGAMMMAAFDRAALQELARQGSGQYVDATVDDRDIERLLEQAPPAQLTDTGEQVRADVWQDQGHWLLLPLLPIAALAFRRGWLSPLLLLLLAAGLAPDANALSWSDLWQRPDQQAAADLAQGRAAEAAAKFRDPAWRAAAAYQAGDYPAALDGLSGHEDPESRYNRGNALARSGALEQAIAEYDQVLKARPDHADARFNRDLLSRLLEEQQLNQQSGGNQPQDGEQAGEDQQQEQQNAGQQSGSDRKDAQGEQQQTPSAQADAQPGEAGEPGRDDLQAGQVPYEIGPEPVDQGAAPRADSEDQGQDEPSEALAGSPSLEEQQADQALELQLRRVPDDPGGLLRQRFMLQHLRRNGEL